MSINKGMMSSNTDMWETPQALFDAYNSVYDFDIDVCAVPSNAKCERYFTPDVDGLKQDWVGTCWMNPPYGRKIGKWVKKPTKNLKTDPLLSAYSRRGQIQHGSMITA